jgi:hypothetical protein
MTALLSEQEPGGSQFTDSGLPPKSKIDCFRSSGSAKRCRGIQLRLFEKLSRRDGFFRRAKR